MTDSTTTTGSKPSDVESPPDQAGAGESDTAQPAKRRVGGGLRVLRGARVAWAVALLALVAATVFGLEARSLTAREEARLQALQAGEVAALQLTTFSGATIDEWVEQTRSLATGPFADEIAQRYDQQLRADLREFDVQSVGEVLSSFVQDLEGDEAVVFAVLRQTTRYPTYEQTVEDEVRFEVSLQRQNGTWLVSDAKLLSPTPPLAPRPFLEEPPEEEG